MIITPGTSEHLLALLRQYTAYEAKVREHLPELSPGHVADISAGLAKSSPGLPAELVAMAPDAASVRVRAEIQSLQQSDAPIFEKEPLGQHLVRLLFAANPGQDLGSLRAAVDRMQSNDKRRCAYAAIRALIAENKPVPQPRPDDGNIACSPRACASKPGDEFGRGQIGG